MHAASLNRTESCIAKCQNYVGNVNVAIQRPDPNRLFEQSLVLFFLSMPPLGGLIVLYQAMKNAPQFWETVAMIGIICLLVGAHIKWVRPFFRRFPWVESYSEIRRRSESLKTRHPKLVQHALGQRMLRSAYRISFGILVMIPLADLYRIHGKHFAWFMLGYAICGFGITVGYHRIGTHPSFKTSPLMRGILLSMGIWAMQGPPSEWMKKHSMHHAFGETTADVHSPYIFDDTKRGIFREQFMSFMHSFMMWAFRVETFMRPRGMSIEAYKARLLSRSPDPKSFRYRESDAYHWEVRGKDGEIVVSTETLINRRWARLVDTVVKIEMDPVVQFLSKPLVYLAILASSIAIPYYLGGISVWESLARICFVNWVTFCVNSVCHLWGEQPFKVPDNSRNNAVIEILALGEGGHNTHHKSELWAQHGIFAWQTDFAAVFIKGLRALGLAWDLNLPTKQVIVRSWRAWRRREPWMQGYGPKVSISSTGWGINPIHVEEIEESDAREPAIA